MWWNSIYKTCLKKCEIFFDQPNNLELTSVAYSDVCSRVNVPRLFINLFCSLGEHNCMLYSNIIINKNLAYLI